MKPSQHRLALIYGSRERMGQGGSRMQEEIGMSLQSTVGVCREQVQSERSGIKEGEGERQDRP